MIQQLHEQYYYWMICMQLHEWLSACYDAVTDDAYVVHNSATG